MPIFTFNCENCGDFELIAQSVKNFFIEKGVDLYEDDAIVDCSSCGAKSYKKNSVESSSFKLNGTGWYKTDYSGK